MNKQYGAVTLLSSLILMTLSTLIVIFSANNQRMQQISVSNLDRNNQAFTAAQAGLEYGTAYLQGNSATVVASPVSGYINYTVGPTTLANNTTHTVTYTNPVANNYDLLTVTSVGRSDDGSSTRTVSQRVQSGSRLRVLPTVALSTLAAVKLKHDAVITNTTTNKNIETGSTVLIQHDGHTVTSSGTVSTKDGIGGDVQQNNATLAAMTSADFIASYMGTSNLNTLKGQANYSYTSGSGKTDYGSTLNGITGSTIYIDGSGGKARIRDNTVIGSATNPVMLIVNGKVRIAGNATVYGFVLVIDGDDDEDEEDSDGEGTLSKNATIIGGFATTDNVKVAKNANLIYNQSVLNNLRNQNSMRYFAKIPGSWKDF